MSGTHDHGFGDTRVVQASQVRQSFSDFVDDCWGRGRRVVIHRNGKPVAALVSVADLHSLLAADREQGETLLREAADGEAGPPSVAVLAVGEDKDELHGATKKMIAVATRMIVPIAIKAAYDAIEAAIKDKHSDHEILGAKQESEIRDRVLAEFETAA